MQNAISGQLSDSCHFLVTTFRELHLLHRLNTWRILVDLRLGEVRLCQVLLRDLTIDLDVSWRSNLV